MNRPDFLSSPQSWTRTSRHKHDRINDACAVERYRPKSDSRFTLADWLLFLIAALFLALIFTGNA